MSIEMMDDAVATQLRSLRDSAAQDASALARQVAETDDWQWQLDKLLQRRTTAYLYGLALEHDVDVAARRAVGLIREAATDSGSTNLYDRAMRESKAGAARQALSGLVFAGLTHSRIGELLVGDR